jgi:hypothetical protein
VKFYHATTWHWPAEHEVIASSKTTFYPEASEALDARRPADAPSRTVCVFASESAKFATYYLLKQNVAAEWIKLYEVEMVESRKAPFAIVHALSRCLEKKQDASRLIDEYWHPQKSWNSYELFGPCMKVKSKLEQLPELNLTLLKFDYDGDASTAKGLWYKPPPPNWLPPK